VNTYITDTAAITIIVVIYITVTAAITIIVVIYIYITTITTTTIIININIIFLVTVTIAVVAILVISAIAARITPILHYKEPIRQKSVPTVSCHKIQVDLHHLRHLRPAAEVPAVKETKQRSAHDKVSITSYD
jgi:hypothetical protein